MTNFFIERVNDLKEPKMPMDSPPPLEPDYTDTLPPPISDLAGTDSGPIEDVMSSLKLSDSAIGKEHFF